MRGLSGRTLARGDRVIRGWALPVRAGFIILHADSPYMPQRPLHSILLWNFFFRWLPGLFLVFGVMPAVYAQLPLVLETNVVAGTCGNTNDTLTIIDSGGISPYQVVVTGGPTPIAPFTLTLPANGTHASKQFTGLGLGTYTVTVTDFAGTTVVKQPSLNSIPGPQQVNYSASKQATCLNNDGEVSATVVGGTPPFSFLYNGATMGTIPSPSFSGQAATGLPSGDLTLTVSDGNGCTLPGQVAVGLNNNLTATVAGATICEGTSTQLTVTSNASSFSWSPATGLSSTSIENPVASPDVTTVYTLTTTLGVCPPLQTPLTIDVLPAPAPVAVSPDTTCYGKDITLQGSGGTTYTWTPRTYLSNPSIADPLVVAPTSSVVYNLSVTDANGCKSLKPAVVDLVVRPPYVVSSGPDTSVMVGQAVDLQAVDVQGIGFSSYAWTPGTFLSNPSIADPVATFSETGIYTYVVNATGPNGCTAADSITVRVYSVSDIFVPNAFTPNGDGHNDVLRAIPVSMRSFKYLTVFNRWGQQVFTTTNAGVGWDGNFGGQPAPQGTYVWIVGGIDYTGRVVEKRGTVVLIR